MIVHLLEIFFSKKDAHARHAGATAPPTALRKTLAVLSFLLPFARPQVQDAVLAKFGVGGDPANPLAPLQARLAARSARAARRRAAVRQQAGFWSLVALRRGPGPNHGPQHASRALGGEGAALGRHGGAVGATAVRVAIAGNSAVLVAKLGAYVYSGSGAMLSEAMHSGADVMNQVPSLFNPLHLLLPSIRHPLLPSSFSTSCSRSACSS